MRLFFKIIIICGFIGLAIIAISALAMNRPFTGLIAVIAMILILVTIIAE